MSNPERDEEMLRQHEEFLNQVTESGLPLWMVTYYEGLHSAQHAHEKPKKDAYESVEKDDSHHSRVDDPPLFI